MFASHDSCPQTPACCPALTGAVIPTTASTNVHEGEKNYPTPLTLNSLIISVCRGNMRSNTFQITVRCGGSGTLTQTGNRICWSSTVVTVCESKSHLQYGDVPREALHRLVQLPALQPFLHGQVMEVLVKFHRWEKKKR